VDGERILQPSVSGNNHAVREASLQISQICPAMLDQLQAFIDVAARGSFSAVAKDRNVAVSSIARQVDALEASLGVPLFHRSSRRLLLTDAGQQFLPRAIDIVSELHDAKAALLDAQAEPAGVLSVTAPSAFGRRHVAPAAMSFLQRYPKIDLDLHFSDQWVDLSQVRVDVAIRSGVLPASDLTAAPLAPVRRLACASPHYLARHGRPSRPEELLHHSCLTVSEASRTPQGWWSFAGAKPLSVKGRLRSDDTEALLQGALAGLGVVHLASWMVADHIAEGRLVQLFADAERASKEKSQIHAVRLKGRSHAARARLFIDHLRSSFGSPPYWDVAASRGSS
jgi:DNA-binding transcriptional LysR family regulator